MKCPKTIPSPRRGFDGADKPTQAGSHLFAGFPAQQMS
jgi:hypothetical protein